MRWEGLAALAFAISLVACDKRVDTSKQAPSATTTTAAMIATLSPPTRPATIVYVDAKPMVFPAAKMIVTKQAGGINVVLCSDDPMDAKEATYRGNSFFFDMNLDVDSTDDLPSISWDFKAANDQPQDSTNGIYLRDSGRELQPTDVKISFQSVRGKIMANLDGMFVSFDPQDLTSTVQHVRVEAQLDASVQESN